MIKIKAFIFNSFRVNTYILADDTNECVIIDPGCGTEEERNELRTFISEQNLKPTKLINTHMHLDHILGNTWVTKTYGLKPIAHPASQIFWESAEEFGKAMAIPVDDIAAPENFVEENDTIAFGNASLKVIYAPGHADGSICLYCEEDHFLISGDVLFRDSIGRTDLPTGNYDKLRETIITKLFSLPDETLVFSGHGPHTTIGYEKKNNPFVYLAN